MYHCIRRYFFIPSLMVLCEKFTLTKRSKIGLTFLQSCSSCRNLKTRNGKKETLELGSIYLFMLSDVCVLVTKRKLGFRKSRFYQKVCYIWWFFKLECTEKQRKSLRNKRQKIKKNLYSTCHKPNLLLRYLIPGTRKFDFGYILSVTSTCVCQEKLGKSNKKL